MLLEETRAQRRPGRVARAHRDAVLVHDAVVPAQRVQRRVVARVGVGLDLHAPGVHAQARQQRHAGGRAACVLAHAAVFVEEPGLHRALPVYCRKDGRA
ncbi:hypothetical protein [Rubrivivax gelatinosus]|uniref:hypothetical protein n=1 Tax=Rubrivivax gelatinosus TaxID=28068 RepID=UPI0034DB2A03